MFQIILYSYLIELTWFRRRPTKCSASLEHISGSAHGDLGSDTNFTNLQNNQTKMDSTQGE